MNIFTELDTYKKVFETHKKDYSDEYANGVNDTLRDLESRFKEKLGNVGDS